MAGVTHGWRPSSLSSSQRRSLGILVLFGNEEQEVVGLQDPAVTCAGALSVALEEG